MVLPKHINDGIKLISVNGYKLYYYFILASFIVDFKEQVFILDIKANMQYLICYFSSKEKESVI